jgi:carboxyl-terminal processing protease
MPIPEERGATMKATWITAAIIGCAAAFVLNYPALRGRNDSSTGQVAGIMELREKIITKYVDPVDEERLYYGALKGMVEELDQYGAVIEPKDVEEFINSVEGKFGGLGIYVTKEGGTLTVITPIEGTPAFKEGILAGDKILRIDGESTEGFDLVEASKRLKGKEGTKVTLTVLHPGEIVPADIVITRAIIRIESVKEARIIDSVHEIGYLRILQFQEETHPDFVREVQRLREQGMRSLVLDLRFNPGGLFKSAVEVADEFLNAGKIVITVGRDGKQSVIEANEGGFLIDLPIVVLINRGTASAAEIVTGALQDNSRALVVGARSFGKGLVQTVFKVDKERSRLKLTTARYYTPNGHSINKGTLCLHEAKKCFHKANEEDFKLGGLRPDVEVQITEAQEMELRRYVQEMAREPKRDSEFWAKHSPILNTLDLQLSRALDYLRNLKLYEETLAKSGSHSM